MKRPNLAAPLDSRGGSLAQSLLETVRRRLPVVDQTLRDYGNTPVSEYLRHVVAKPASGYQPRGEVAEAVYCYAAELLDEQVARQVRTDLSDCPAVLTANHHGVDFFAQSLQTTLLFSLRSADGGLSPATVPVLACGNVPLNNITYPRGALVYAGGFDGTGNWPRRLPLFPDRYKRRTVSLVAGFDETMVRRAEGRVAGLHRDGVITGAVAEALRGILMNDYNAPRVLDRETYSEQSVILNGRIWQQLFVDSAPAPQLVYLELERMAGMLLEADLRDQASLAFVTVFDAQLREDLLRELNGVRGCWQRQEFSRVAAQTHNTSTTVGTFLFWGIDESGRRVSLLPDGAGDKARLLCGLDDSGQAWQVPLQPQEIIQGLQERRLLPSLFTCYLVIGLARGVILAGGYYQANYLPAMQQGVVAALRRHGALNYVADWIARVPTKSYLSGMQAVMNRTSNGGLIPAGPVEIIADGGLKPEDIERIGSLTVADAHLASLLETVADVAPQACEPGWRERLAEECGVLLEGKVVVR